MDIYTFKPTFLYIKQHTLTGKLYFGKTTKNPEKYLGSGTYWKNHIKKHGKEFVVNLWYCLFYDEQECEDFALNFSHQNNISESSIWANQIPENGLDGCGTIGYVSAKDIDSGITCMVSKETFDSSPNLVGVNYKSDEISKSSSNYAKGKVTCKDSTGKYFRVEKEVFDSNNDLVGVNSGSKGTRGSLGMIWINNTISQLLIEPYLLLDYPEWKLGKLPMSNEQKKLISKTKKEKNIPASNKGKSEYIKDGKIKYFFKDNVPLGWIPNVGREGNNKGKHWFNDGTYNFLISNEEAVVRNLRKGMLRIIKTQSTDFQ